MSKENKTIKAVALCRVSATEQTANNMSIEAQQRRIDKLAKRQNTTVVKWWKITSYGEPYLEDIFEFCLEHEDIKYLLVSSLDRICRCADHYNQSVDSFKQIDVEVLSGSPVEMFMQTIQRGMASYQSKELTERVKRGMHHKAAQGYFLGKPPLGYEQTTTKGVYQPTDLGEAIGSIMRAVADGRLTFDGAHQALQIYPTIGKAKQPNKTKTMKLITNPYYAGLIVWHGETHKGLHKPLISLEQHEAIVQLSESTTRV